TTSLDSLYMGVPIVTLPGQSAFSRATFSQLTNLGLLDFVAESAEDYVRIARAFAAGLGGLARIRKSLRGKVLGSVLCDSARLARNLEQAYRAAWRQWCNSRSSQKS